jgi:signal recognition particle receptor subunit beta
MKLKEIKKELNTDLPIKKIKELINSISPSEIKIEIRKQKDENSIISILKRKMKKL